MDDKADFDISQIQLMQWVTEGKIPKELSDISLKDLKKNMKKIVEFQNLKNKKTSTKDFASFFAEQSSQEEMVQGLALYNFILKISTL